MTKYIALWMFSVIISSFSQILLKAAANKTYPDRLHEYLNPLVIGAYGIFFISTLLTLTALRYVPYRYSSVIEATSYIFIPVFGYLILREKITLRRVSGILIILAGIGIFSTGLA